MSYLRDLWRRLMDYDLGWVVMRRTDYEAMTTDYETMAVRIEKYERRAASQRKSRALAAERDARLALDPDPFKEPA